MKVMVSDWKRMSKEKQTYRVEFLNILDNQKKDCYATRPPPQKHANASSLFINRKD
jgi:hypothetical protein